MNRKTATLVMLLTASAHSHADWDTSIQLSPGIIHFDYTEFSTLGNTLNNEQGWLPGVALSLSARHDSGWGIKGTVTGYQGVVDYDGQTQQGDSHVTRTDTRFTRAGLELSRATLPTLELVAGYTSHEWIRDIRDNGDVFGLLEEYSWDEYALGARLNLYSTSSNRLDIEASYLTIRNSTIFVDLTRADYGSTTLDIGDGSGGRIAGRLTRRAGSNIRTGFTLVYEVWDFARSNTRATQGGSTSLLVTEPRSETRNLSLSADITYVF